MTSLDSTPVATPPESPSNKHANGNASNTPVTFKWPPAERDYTDEYQTMASSIKLNLVHTRPIDKPAQTIQVKPLSEQSNTRSNSPSNNQSSRDDPLSPSTGPSNNDPLSMLTSHSTASHLHSKTTNEPINLLNKQSSGIESEDYEPWRARRERITSRYQTNKKIAVKTAFLDDEKSSSKPGDSTKTRLQELLEQQENQSNNLSSNQSNAQNGRQSPSLGGGITVQMNQTEFLAHIADQSIKLKSAWDSGERVTSLKIAIQCAKLLGDQSNSSSHAALAFYPSAFVSLTAILDQFGDLVFDRIRDKGSESINQTTKQRVSSSLPPSFKAVDTTAQAKETCRNWFYKTACIRELLPRLYVDMCMLKCYRFLDEPAAFVEHFRRTSAMIRGIGDPLTSLYARAYLAVKMGDFYTSFHSEAPRSGDARHITKEYQAILTESFIDFIEVFAHHSANGFSSIRAVREDRCTGDEYVDLMAPAIDWIAQNIGYKADKDVYNRVFTVWKEKCNHAALLAPLIDHFPRDLIGRTSIQLVTLIFESVETAQATQSINTPTPLPPSDGSPPPKLLTSLAVGKAQCFAALGRAIADSPPPQEKHRLAVLNEVWKWVTKIQSINQYMELAVIYINFLIKHFTERELNIFMRDLIKHVKPNQQYKHVQHELAIIILNLMQQSKDLNTTLKLESFLSVLDLLENRTNFQNQSIKGMINQTNSNAKFMAAKIVLLTFRSKPFTINPSNEPLILHTLMELGRILHDACDSLTFDDEKKQISDLLISFIQSVDYGRDVEQQLSFYTDCREAYRNLELVLIQLVQHVSALTNKCLMMVSGQTHNKKSAAFVRACMAFMHITIPSFGDVPVKLRLLLMAAQTGLVHHMIGQSEACIKTAIALIHDANHEVTREDDVDTKASNQTISHAADAELVRYVLELQAFLLIFPGHPDHGPFYLVTGLINAINARPQWKQSNIQSLKSRFRIYMGLLTLFFAYAQRTFPYHIVGVESNDSLYGGEASYMQQVSAYLDTIMDELTDMLGVIGERTDLVSKQTVCSMSLELVNLLFDSMKIETSQHATLVVKLVQLAAKQGTASNPAQILATIQHLKLVRSPWTNEILNKLSALSIAQPVAQQRVVSSLSREPARIEVQKPVTNGTSAKPVTFGRMPSAGPQARVQGPL